MNHLAPIANYLLITEWVSGIVALLTTAIAFTELSLGEGASSGAMQKQALKRAKRRFIWAGGFWALTILCFLFLKYTR